MKLSEILEEVKVGSEAFKEQKTSKELIESFDEDIDNYKISSLISAINNKFIENINEDTTPVIKTFRKIENKIKMLEERIEKHNYISEAYARMKYDSLSEDFNSLYESLKSKKTQRQFDKEKLTHAIGLVLYEAKKLAKEGNFDFQEKDFPSLNENLQPSVEKELKLIEENIGY